MLVQFSIFPVGKGEELAKSVAEIIDLIDRSKLPYQTTAMSTIVEGNWNEVFSLIKKCHTAMRKEHNRVYLVITADDRKGAKGRLKGKVNDVEKILRRKIKR
ncbi:MAG: MTH1187 family thiamine-binding protein [candidate division Zixibacteria bacterium]|nr:MTH1187 family thiamine-binding protein [candidate division Zixibacteria bacterium]